MQQILFCIIALAAFSLAGCDSSDKASPPRPIEAKPVAVKSGPVVQLPNDKLLVGIIPDPPTADGCLKALVSGRVQASYLWEINGENVAEQTTNLLCEGFRQNDEVQVTVNSGKASGTVSVIVTNAPPRITAVTINDDGIAKHGDLVVKPEVLDVDGDPVELRYQWYVNGEAETLLTEDTLSATSYHRGDTISFTIIPFDGIADGKTYHSATLTVPNAAPQILSQLPEKFEAMEYSYQIEALDPDGDAVTYTLEEAPDGMIVNQASGLITWPLAGVKQGTYSAKIVVSDPDGAIAYQTFTLAIGAPKNTALPSTQPVKN
ncbi:MAG: putative Ig domain-containing protein [Desulfuromonadales bacterium]